MRALCGEKNVNFCKAGAATEGEWSAISITPRDGYDCHLDANSSGFCCNVTTGIPHKQDYHSVGLHNVDLICIKKISDDDGWWAETIAETIARESKG